MTDEQTNDPDTIINAHDTPTQRVAINQLSVDELDAWLEAIRARRLATVQRLEAAAKVKSDDVRLTAFLKFQNQYKRAKNAMTKLDEQMTKVESIVHKARILALSAELEAGVEEEDKDGDE